MTAGNRADIGRQLGGLVSSWRELDPVMDGALAVDGLLPGFWCEPSASEELAAVLAFAGRERLAVIPRGGGSRMALGMPPRAADIVVSTRGMSGIVEYEPADLTITVQAGLGLTALRERLAGEGQLLTLDPPSAEIATVGGIIASNASGPMRPRYGSARDLVIGMRIANSDGTLTKSGGRVVKNVAGYDLNKLYTGSLGTLGVIAELSFKLAPLPQCRGTMLAVFKDVRVADEVVRQVNRSPLGPTALELLNDRAVESLGLGIDVPRRGCLLAAQSTGFEAAVRRVVRDIAAMAAEAGGSDAGTSVDTARDLNLWRAVAALPDASDADRPVLKLAAPPSRTGEAFARLVAETDAAELAARVVVHAGVGLAYARLDHANWDGEAADRLVGLVERLRSWAAERKGSLVLEACPPAIKQRTDVWGEIGPALRIMQALKQQLEPAGILNPGRFVGGI
ncbi:MAG: FAD-binding oxidoreductase [Chloroflexi bacterium]|nr:FAD-binding oxidoreductase [Chloroflexota bacterium]